ncbi:ubiquitin-conjugating enzyme E2 S isoform X1 [Python bivittatus]|uniref:Ubiquitin-conjugating enzyme E2 S isoform X1 n=1 Tax=Python bivittatus TaxID=176946 RepID=A0A9F5IVN0_PYTBI|nr:ubiquitin-conjugating enzyme E2 S isoform X1 [Python bivittatus]
MNSNVENLPPHVIRLVYKEVSILTSDPPEGIKVFPNEEDITDVQVTIEGPEGTPYSGGLFRMKLILGKDFPASPPKGYFLTKIFHPNVGANGEICVNVLKKDWKAELGIRHVLLLVTIMALPSTLPYDRVTVNMEREEVCLERTKSQLDPRLVSTTTGGVEASCHSCLLPFGLLASIIGLATTSVACANGPPDSVLTVLGGVLLATGLLGAATSCMWQQYRRRKRCSSWTLLTAETEAKKPVI